MSTPLPYHWNRSYAQRRWHELGLCDADNFIDETFGAKRFHVEPVPKSDDIKIRFTDVFGQPLLYADGKVSVGKETKKRRSQYHQIRYKAPPLRGDRKTGKKKPMKYQNPKHTPTRVAGNGVFQYFVRQGVTTIKTLAITEGVFKALMLSANGMPCLGTIGIFGHLDNHKDSEGKWVNSVFRTEVLEQLLALEVEKVILVHDQDATHNEHKIDRASQFSASVAYTCRACKNAGLAFEYRHVATLAEGKGVDDVMMRYSDRVSAFRDAFYSHQDTFFFKTFVPAAVSGAAGRPVFSDKELTTIRKHLSHAYNSPALQPNEVWPVRRYASEKCDAALQAIEKHGNVAFTMRTGGGKTDLGYLLADWYTIAGRPGRIFFTYPTNLASEQKTREYARKEANPHGIALDIFMYDQYTPAEDLKLINQFRFFSLHPSRLAEFDLQPDDVLIVDETHKFVMDSYENTEDTMETILTAPCKKVFLSGTPFREFYATHHIHEIEIVQRDCQQVNVNIVELHQGDRESFNVEGALNTSMAAVDQYVKGLPSDQPLLYPIFIQSKQRIDELEKLIDKAKFDVEVLYSEPEIKTSDLWRTLCDTGRIPVGNKPLILLCTPILYEAVRIKNDNLGRIAIFTETWPENIIQAAGRAAGPRQLEVDVYWLCRKNHEVGYFVSYEAFRAKYYQNYERLKEIYDQYQLLMENPLPGQDYPSQMTSLLKANKIIRKDGSFNEFTVLREFLRSRNRKESNYQKAQRLHHTFSVRRYERLDISPSEPVCEALDQLIVRREDDKSLAAKKVLESPEFALNMVATTRNSHSLKERTKEVLGARYDKNIQDNEDYQQWYEGLSKGARKYVTRTAGRYATLAQQFQEEPRSFIDVIVAKGNNFRVVPVALEIFDRLDRPPENFYQAIDQKVLQQICDAFLVDQWYTPQEIDETITAILQEYPGLRLPTQKTSELFSILFEKKETHKDGRKYRIVKRRTKKDYAAALGLSLRGDSHSVNKTILTSRPRPHSPPAETNIISNVPVAEETDAYQSVVAEEGAVPINDHGYPAFWDT